MAIDFFSDTTGYTDSTKPKLENTYESRKEGLISLIDTHINYLTGQELGVGKDYKAIQKDVTTYKNGQIVISIRLSNKLVKFNGDTKRSFAFTGTADKIKEKRIEVIKSLYDLTIADNSIVKEALENFVKEYSESIKNRKKPVRNKDDS